MDKIAVNYEKMYYGFPVILVSFYDENGQPNVTPISSSYSLKDMIALGFNSKGYAVSQIKKVRDFVINVPDRTILDEIKYCGAHTGSEQSKLEHVNLTDVKAPHVNAPMIRECPISIECTLSEVIERDEFKGITNVLAQIKGRHVAEHYLDADGGLEASEFDNILYIGDGFQKSFRYMS